MAAFCGVGGDTAPPIPNRGLGGCGTIGGGAVAGGLGGCVLTQTRPMTPCAATALDVFSSIMLGH